MKKAQIVGLLMLAFLGAGINPVFSLDKPPVKPYQAKSKATTKIKARVKQDTIQSLDTAVNPLYPTKYTRTYIDGIKNEYRSVGKDEVFYVALDMLKGTNGDFSRKAILGSNLTQKPIRVEFKDLGQINKTYTDYDALGWKRGGKLYIYVSQKHNTSPAIAIAALLSHEALHQDEYNSMSEETYAWTMEAAVFTELVGLYPNYQLPQDSLVQREQTLKKLYLRGDYSNKYIKKTVYSNEGYQNLPETSPGFEAL